MQYTPYIGQYPGYMQQPYQPMSLNDRAQVLQNMYNSQTYPMQQQSIQQTPQNFLQGKVVDSKDVVKATDVPMDGSYYYFPKADGTEIYSKRWLPNGTTEISTYIPKFDSENVDTKMPDNSFDLEFKNEIVDLLNNINGRIDNLEKSLNKVNNKSTSNKKEG